MQLSKSGSQSVYLRNVELTSGGKYRCEVSAEAPEFQTVAAEKKMDVFEIKLLTLETLSTNCKLCFNALTSLYLYQTFKSYSNRIPCYSQLRSS
ncbi:hypothetical protein CEXT_563811 [Caerostris extrusa]|uniref:Uncharacterized protein n=1 Tax=Caerostris extrusa TaxID=172846 RepID=A0AAV4PJV7_CAEEX|nr:hypothetical protein CEXT_563811 [Caerostris extrusa]